MKKLFLFILTLFIPFVIKAEELKMDWQKSFGGNSEDNFYELLQTEDDGFIAYGYSYSTDIEGLPNKGYEDAIIVKYDKNGNLMWQKSWGGNNSDEFHELLQTEDDGFIAYGYSYSTDIEGLPNKGSADAIIIKYDKDGNLMWQKSWGGNKSDELFELFQTKDGCFIAYAYSYSTDIEGLPNKGSADAIIIKYDKDGNLMWQKSFGGNNEDKFYELLQTGDGGFIAYGYSYSTDIEGLPNKGSADAIIIKYDKDGNLLWQKSWGGNSEDRFYELLQTEDGGFIAYGYSYSTDIEGLPNKGYTDVIIVKYDKDGNLMWQKSWGGNNGEDFLNVLQTKDGGFIAYGYSYSTDIEGLPNKGENDALIVKYSIIYDLKNTTTANGISTVEQQGSKGIITPTPNEGYEVDKIIVKDKSGNVLDVEVTKQEDGTYSFELYTDVSVEVLFKEKLVNPKTGIVSYIGEILAILFISISTFCVLVFNKKSYRL